MSAPQLTLLTRRQLLAGGAATVAGMALLGACGDGDGGGDEPEARELAMAQFFGGPMFVAGQESRLPFGLAGTDGLLPTEETPTSLRVQIIDPDGSELGSPVEVARHDAGLPRAYFPLRVTIDEPGIYTARAEIEGVASEMSFQILEAADVKVIGVGAAVPAVETPTLADARGVNPVCTSDPVCSLHEVTLSEALAAGEPVALLVATPAFCQLAICGPVLDVLLEVADDHPDVRFLHAEVYADPAKDLQTYAPVVDALGLHFEPCLVLIGADGTVADRIDTIYDRDELGERLARLTA